MNEKEFLGYLIGGLLTLFTFVKAIDWFGSKRREDKRKLHEMEIEQLKESNRLRTEQTEATNRSTLAMEKLTYEMKMMRTEIKDLERRTNDLEVIVYKKDR